MNVFKIAKGIKSVIDKLTGVKYTADMTDKPIISPERFGAIKEVYDEAVQQRQEEIKRLYFVKKWNQKKIAEHMKMDLTQVNRFIRRIERSDE